MKVYEWQTGHWIALNSGINLRNARIRLLDGERKGKARVMTNERGDVRETTYLESYMIGTNLKEWME